MEYHEDPIIRCEKHPRKLCTAMAEAEDGLAFL
jgi:hypothetical protein